MVAIVSGVIRLTASDPKIPRDGSEVSMISDWNFQIALVFSEIISMVIPGIFVSLSH
jgi:hypothetical protein